MKTLTFLITLFTLALSTLNAQLMIGPKAGIGASMYQFDQRMNDAFDPGVSLSYSIGVKSRLPLFSGVELMPEINYTVRGGRLIAEEPVKNQWGEAVVFEENGQEYHINQYDRITTGYLDIPLLIAYKFRGKEFAPYLFMGPTFSVALHGTNERTFKDDDEIAVPKKWLDQYQLNEFKSSSEFGSGRNDPYASGDVSLTIGGGFYYELDFGRLALDVRYDIGTKNIFNENYSAWSRGMMENRSLLLSVGYLFSLSDL